MMTEKHTPGPWEVVSFEDMGYKYHDIKKRYSESSGDVGEVCTVSPYAGGYAEVVDDDEIEANARLIAAAPDLLEVLLKVDACLQEYIEFLDSERFSNDDEVELLVLVQAAIAKAEVG